MVKRKKLVGRVNMSAGKNAVRKKKTTKKEVQYNKELVRERQKILPSTKKFIKRNKN